MASEYPKGRSVRRPGNNGNSEERCRIALGGPVFVMAKPWKGNVLIHIRKYDTENGRTFPTRLGVTLQLRQWMDLKAHSKEIDESIMTLKQGKEVKLFTHLGSNLYVSVDHRFPGVNVRQWWWCKEVNAVKPSRNKGIFLRVEQWEQLKDTFLVMEDFVPELNGTIPCAMQEDHQNQEGALRCAFCNPIDYMNW